MLDIFRIETMLMYQYIKQYIEQMFYISAVQAKTFSIVKQLNGMMNGKRRYTINKIVNNIMKLQELMLTKDQNKIAYKKIVEVHVFVDYIIIQNMYCNSCFDMSHKIQESIHLIFYQLLIQLGDDYLSEKEVYEIIDKYRIQIKYKGR